MKKTSTNCSSEHDCLIFYSRALHFSRSYQAFCNWLFYKQIHDTLSNAAYINGNNANEEFKVYALQTRIEAAICLTQNPQLKFEEWIKGDFEKIPITGSEALAHLFTEQENKLPARNLEYKRCQHALQDLLKQPRVDKQSAAQLKEDLGAIAKALKLENKHKPSEYNNAAGMIKIIGDRAHLHIARAGNPEQNLVNAQNLAQLNG